VRSCLGLLALAWLAGASGAGAQEAQVRAGNQLEIYYDTKVEESVIDDRLDLELEYGRFGAGVVFLSHTPSDPLRLDPNDFGARQEGLRKRWVTAAIDPIELRLGDSYASFGNGLVLRIFEDQLVDFDNVVDGAYGSVAYRGARVSMIAGTNSIGPERAIVKGLSAEVQAEGGWLLGLNGAFVDSVDGATPAPGRDGVAGLNGHALLPGGVDLTAEYAIRHYRPERPNRNAPDDGHGAYVAANTTIGPVALLAEAKDLLRFDHAYTTPPTAVRQHVSSLLNRGSHVPNIRLEDERGWQAEISWSVRPELILTANHSASDARHAELPAWESFGQVEADVGGAHWILYGAETEEKIREGLDRTFFERITFGGDVVRELGRSWGLELAYETQETRQQDLARAAFEFPIEFRDHMLGVTLSKSPRHTWAATIEWTDSPIESEDLWVWVEWNLRLGVIGQLNLAGGSLRGGQVCSGGVCKFVDPFEGGRLEILTNF
jgi:hypothetical protein